MSTNPDQRDFPTKGAGVTTDDAQEGMTTHDEEMSRAAECVAPWAEKAIRRDERMRLAALLEHHGEAITAYTSDDSNTLKLVAYMLRLDGPNA